MSSCTPCDGDTDARQALTHAIRGVERALRVLDGRKARLRDALRAVDGAAATGDQTPFLPGIREVVGLGAEE